MCVAQ
jgi:Transposase IS116/IS110/IS902 family